MRMTGAVLSVLLTCMAAVSLTGFSAASAIPPFGKDTVLVWESHNQDVVSKLVVRVAEFFPDRYIEWEDATTQGTIFFPNRAVTSAKGYVNSQLFEAGMDTRSKNETTLWLSQQVYRQIKTKQRLRIPVDSIPSWLTLEGTGTIKVEVNRKPVELPVLKIKDDRGSERWFLDSEENPLLAKHTIRNYTQDLVSITTDRANTLRWIKGKKLAHPPH